MEELKEFDTALVQASENKNGELNEDELGEVSGGCLVLTPILIGVTLSELARQRKGRW